MQQQKRFSMLTSDEARAAAAAMAATNAAFDQTPSVQEEDDFADEAAFEEEYFAEGDLTAIFSSALATTSMTRVTIPQLANLLPAAQQFNLVKAIMGKLLLSMQDGRVVFDNTAAMVKLGPVLIKLAKAANTMVVSDFVELGNYSLEDLLSNLGSVTLRRKPRTDPFKLIAYAASNGSIADIDLRDNSFSAVVGGVKYWFRFSTRMCVEMHRDEVKPNFTMKNTEISKFKSLLGAIRRDVFPGSKTARTWHAVFKFPRANKESLRTEFLEGMVKYTNEFIAWCSRNINPINGEDLWFAASDGCRSLEEIPTPYIVTMQGKTFISDYFALAETWVKLFKKGDILSSSSILDALRSLRAGTLLDHRVSKSTGDPVIGLLGTRAIFYETVVSKIGDLYPALVKHEGYVHYVGVTKAANLMVKAVIACATEAKVKLYDLEARPSLVTPQGTFAVEPLNIVPPKTNATLYTLPKNLEDSWVILDTTPGANLKEMNACNLRYSEKCLENGAAAVVVKLFRHDSPAIATYFGQFLNRGRCHNGEFFAVFFNHKVPEYGVETLYLHQEWLGNWEHNNMLRGCDGIIFGNLVPETYPLIVRDVQSFNVKDHEKYATLVATCASVPMAEEAKIPEEIGKLASKFNFSSSSGNRSWGVPEGATTTSSAPVGSAGKGATSQVEALAQSTNRISEGSSHGRKLVVNAIDQAPEPRILAVQLSQTPSKALRYRTVGCIPNQGIEFVGLEMNGMPVYEVSRDHGPTLLCTSSGWEVVDKVNTMLHGRPEANNGLMYFTHDNFSRAKVVSTASTLLSNAEKRALNARFGEFLKFNYEQNGMCLVSYRLTGSSMIVRIEEVTTNVHGPRAVHQRIDAAIAEIPRE